MNDLNNFILADLQQLVGYALYFPTYSTWVGVCLHLEDVYVTPEYRGGGLGKRMLQTVTKVSCLSVVHSSWLVL
jgi:GNAT superfamily N-acetyltransferase